MSLKKGASLLISLWVFELPAEDEPFYFWQEELEFHFHAVLLRLVFWQDVGYYQVWKQVEDFVDSEEVDEEDTSWNLPE